MIRGGKTYYYHADGLGSIIAITDSNGNVVQRYEYNSFEKYKYGDTSHILTYTYDSLNRLTGVMRGVLEEDRFSYDAVGNRLTDIQARGYTYNNGNELLSYGAGVGQGFSLAYDANGNMISKTNNCGTTSYQFDTENRLIGINGFTINCSLFTADYKYDPFGRRIEKSVTDTVTGTVTITKYVYDREDILFELDGNNNIVTEYLHGPGIDEPIAMIRGGQTYYYHADALGSIIAITDSAGQVVQKYEYDSFGNISYQQDPNFVQPYTYTGREYDEESGLYYYRARYYSPELQRFISEDPIGLVGGINLYTYVGNNPVNWVDPLGLRWWAGAGIVTNQTSDVIAVTGDTRGGNQGVVFIYPGESHNFNKDWIEATGEAARTGSMDPFNDRLLDPDEVWLPGESKGTKIQPYPWDEEIIKPKKPMKPTKCR